MPPVCKIVDSLVERSTQGFPSPLNVAPLPPMIVTEKGESLDEFCARQYPDPFTVIQVRTPASHFRAPIRPMTRQRCTPGRLRSTSVAYVLLWQALKHACVATHAALRKHAYSLAAGWTVQTCLH